jgi:DNA-binding MarR family transcriptional regulator
MGHASAEAGALCQRLIQSAALVEARLEAAVAPSGLSLAKLGVLQHLVEAQSPLPLGQLADRIACVKSNVTQLVDRLEAEGLVRRETDPSDRRVVRAAITAAGRERCAEAAAARSRAEAGLAAGLSPALGAALADLLSVLQREVPAD